MQKFLVLLSISAAITLSFIAKASSEEFRSVDLNYSTASMSPELNLIKVEGRLPNPCTTSPEPTLKLVTRDGASLLVLNVVAEQFGDACAEVISHPYELIFDSSTIKKAVESLGVATNNGLVKIYTKDMRQSFSIDLSQVYSKRSFSTVRVLATLATEQGSKNVLALTESGETYLLKSSAIDVSEYIGQTVQLQGHLLRMRTMRIAPDADQSSKNSVLVTGIHIAD